MFPENPKAESPAKVEVSGIKQVGIVVKDAVQSAENYWDILGIGPWEIRPWGNHVLWDRTYMGRPGWGRERLGHAYLGDLELEFVQPVEGESIYQDWIDEHGEGLHHLKFLCEDIDEVTRLLAEQGFNSIQSGHFGDPKEILQIVPRYEAVTAADLQRVTQSYFQKSNRTVSVLVPESEAGGSGEEAGS